MNHRQAHEAGLRPFLLWPINDDGTCGCGHPDCQAVGKHPRAGNWQHTPDWSEDQLDTFEEAGWFATGYGILVDGLLVVDVDERNGGADSYALLVEKVPEVSHAGMIVRTGSGGASRHLYFRLPDPAPALVQHLHSLPGIDFKSTGYVVGPGSRHRSGGTYDVLVGGPDEIQEAPAALLDMLRKPERHRATSANGTAVDVSTSDLEDMLGHIHNGPDTDYETWVRVGMALHLVTQGAPEAYALWEAWSARSPKHDPADMDYKWHSFGKHTSPVTFGTLAYYAEQGGWIAPVEFTADAFLDAPSAPALDTTGIDLLRPPGFVGRVAEWIDSRCIYPRQSLAVAAALMAVSGTAGMRYRDPEHGITGNLLAFGVAGSATGKETVQQCLQELYRVAGVAPAVHGAIKSEQEIYRNLCRHQAAIYVIDELGEQLAKVANARAKGTAAYLEGVIGALMSLYTKAAGHALITGDLKEEIRASLQRELAVINKRIDEQGAKEKDERRAGQLMRALGKIDQGLEHPYLSVFGLTAPDRFDSMMDADMASSGFLGRAVIFREHEDNPRPRDVWNKASAVPADISNKLCFLYAPGYSEAPDRVERVGDFKECPTHPDALELLTHARDAFWEMAEDAKDSGLAAVPRRGFELVSKVSMLLAIPEGLRTAEHVRWAYALVRRDIEGKMLLARGNSEPERQDQLAARILAACGEDGATQGVIRNRCGRGKFRREDVDACCDRLVAAGKLHAEETTWQGRKTRRFRRTV